MWYSPIFREFCLPLLPFLFVFITIFPFLPLSLSIYLSSSIFPSPYLSSLPPLKHTCQKTITLCLIPKAHIREYTCEHLLWSKQSVPNLIFRLTTDFMNTAPYSVTAKDYFASPSRCCDYYNSSVETKIRVSLIF